VFWLLGGKTCTTAVQSPNRAGVHKIKEREKTVFEATLNGKKKFKEILILM
jgi:hypothetical protein